MLKLRPSRCTEALFTISITLAIVGSASAQAIESSALATPLAASADPEPQDPVASQSDPPVSQKSPSTLEPNVAPGQAAQRARREYGGRVLNVVLEDGPGGPYYRVKLLDGGRMRIVSVEAHR